MNPLSSRQHSLPVRALTALVAMAALAACGSDKSSSTPAAPLVAQKITVTFDVTSTENELLASIYGQALENAGFRIARRNAMPDRLSMFQAVTNNEVQLVIEHTDDLLTLAYEQNGGQKSTSVGGAQQRAELQTALPPTVVVTTPSPAVRNEIIACTASANAEFPVATLSALAGIADTLTLGAAEGFDTATPLGAAALTEAYGLAFKAVVPLVAADAGKALDDKTVDCIVTDSLNPIVAEKSLTILDDDKFLVTVNAVIPLMTAAAAGGDVVAVLDAVSARLSTTALNQMLSEMAASGTSADVVAKAFLQAGQ